MKFNPMTLGWKSIALEYSIVERSIKNIFFLKMVCNKFRVTATKIMVRHKIDAPFLRLMELIFSLEEK